MCKPGVARFGFTAKLPLLANAICDLKSISGANELNQLPLISYISVVHGVSKCC